MKRPKTKILILGTQASFAKFLLSNNDKEVHFIRYRSKLSMIGVNLTDVIFLDEYEVEYSNILTDLICIYCCLRAKGFNEKTRIRIKTVIDSLNHIEATAKEAKRNVVTSLSNE